VLSLLLVALAASAGCVGLFGSDGQPTPVTPVPVADPPAPGIPAVGGGEPVSAQVRTERLLDAHTRARAAQSHTLERTVIVRGANDTLRLDHRLRVGPNGTTLERLNATGSGRLTLAIESGALWTNGSFRYSRVRLSGGRVVTTRLLSLEGSPFVTDNPLAPSVIRGSSFSVTPRGDGAVLRSTGEVPNARPILPLAMGDPRNVSVRAVVGSDGLVGRLDVSYDVSFAGEPATVDIAHRIVDRGSSTVSRPDWVPDDPGLTATPDQASLSQGRSTPADADTARTRPTPTDPAEARIWSTPTGAPATRGATSGGPPIPPGSLPTPALM
jgi:hypothetical protein